MTTTNISRRQFLRGSAAALILVAGGGVFRAADQGVFSAGSGPAYEPWTTWRSDPTEGPLALVQAGILAANPHNTQPWLFHVSDREITLYADTTRNLGAMDPYLREMYIGLGCALENMLLTAEARGFAVDLAIESGTLRGPAATPEPVRVATLKLTPASAQPSALYAAIPQRRTDRYPYDAERALPNDLPDALAQLSATPDVRFFTFAAGTAEHQRLAAETITATEWIIADKVMSHDSHVWFDSSWQEVQREKDGPYIDTAGVSPLLRAFSKMFNPLIPESAIDDGWLNNTRNTLPTSRMLGLIAVRDLYDVEQTLLAGRLWQRAHLWATSQGLAMQPINQLPEVVDRQRQLGLEPQQAAILADVTGDAAWKPTFAFRLGYPTTAPLPSARRPVNDVLYQRG